MRHKDSGIFLRYKRLSCRIADTLHPLGEQATPKGFRGRTLIDNRCWITPATLVQEPDQPLSALMEWFPARESSGSAAKARLVHVVNLYPPHAAEDNAQSDAIAAIRTAMGAISGPVVAVNVQEASHSDQTPNGFIKGRLLERTIQDIVPASRPFPLLFDILASGAGETKADDVLIFTNSDICPLPHFYSSIRELLAHGFDAITINRRTVGERRAFGSSSPLVFAETGLPHGGYDCFVFRRELFDRFIASTACVGAPGVAMSLVYNMVVAAQRMLMLTNVSLTYHFGNDRIWNSDKFEVLTEHNHRQYLGVVKALAGSPGNLERLGQFVTKFQSPPAVRELISQS